MKGAALAPESAPGHPGQASSPAVVRRCCIPVLFLALLLAYPKSAPTLEFATATTYPAGSAPSAIAVGDFSGDGKLDIAVANTGSNNVSILLGNGDGTFRPAVNFDAGNSPSAIAVGDFNGDGKLDLAVFQASNSQNSTASITVLFGNGDGTFQAPKTTILTGFATTLVVADFNLDKKSDLAVTIQNFSTGLVTVEVLLGKGDGTFQLASQTRTPNANAPVAMAAADFNGDSKPDLAVSSTNAGIQILLGKGDGTFLQGVTVAVAGQVGTVLAADVNQDGKMDLLVANSATFCTQLFRCTTVTSVIAFLGNGDGTLQAGQTVAGASSRFGAPRIDQPLVGDFNGDGKLDVAYRSSGTALQIKLGKGDGTFSPVVSTIAASGLSAAVAGDFNADKLADLALLEGANSVSVILNTSPTSGADVGILTSAASPEPVGVGTSLTYTADVLNQGPQNSTGVVFTDTLPNSVSFVSATATEGSCVQSSGIVTCNVGSLASAFDSTVSIVVTPTATGTITNSMSVTANEPDLVPANNTATQNSTVVPVFTLTVTKTGNGSGTVTATPAGPNGPINCGTTCSTIYLSGTMVSVGETPDANSLFAGWSGACTGTGACSVTMNADMSVTANFVLGEKLSVALAGSGSGSVTSSDGAINCNNSGGSCSTLYLPGTSVSLTAAPAGTSVFGGWSGACAGTDPNACTITMNSDQSVTATFNPPPDFTFTAASAFLTTQTGKQVTDLLTLAGQNGFSGAVTLGCAVTGPMPSATCNVSPSPVMVGSSPATSTLTITAPATLSVLALPPGGAGHALYAVVLPLPLLLLALISATTRKAKPRRRGLRLLGGSLSLVVLLAIAAGCGNSSKPPPGPENFSVTVTATSGPLQHSADVILSVQ